MPSARDCAERLREQAYRTLSPQIRDLEQELQSIGNSVSAGIAQLGRKLEALRSIELPTTEPVLDEILGEISRKKDLQAGALALFARGLRARETQEEILALLLDAARTYVSRSALFAVKGDRFVGWSSRGYAEGQAQAIASCSFARFECARFEEALADDGPSILTEVPDADCVQFLHEQPQGVWFLLPLRVMQRPVALLLATNPDRTSVDADALSILVELASFRLENVALRVLHDVTTSGVDTAPETGEPVMALAASTAPDPGIDEIAERLAAREGRAAVDDSLFQGTVEADLVPGPLPIPDLKANQAPGLTAAVAPDSQNDPNRQNSQSSQNNPNSQNTEEEKLHADAKRFARLLVSEIKLYNEHHVSEGRNNQDLYLRLKRDIDRSREMYEKRVAPVVSRRIDYFHDEIVRILGDNDPSTLGSDYPGPRVES